MPARTPKPAGHAAGGSRRALCPGMFDPVTRGHLDVILRAVRLFDRLFIGVIDNPAKTPLFSLEERVDLLSAELRDAPGVEVIALEGLTVGGAARVGARWIIRGLRSAADAAYELPMAHSNRVCGEEEIETVFLPASPDVAFVSSSLVREIAASGGKLAPFVTPGVERALLRKFGGTRRPGEKSRI